MNALNVESLQCSCFLLRAIHGLVIDWSGELSTTLLDQSEKGLDYIILTEPFKKLFLLLLGHKILTKYNLDICGTSYQM